MRCIQKIPHPQAAALEDDKCILRVFRLVIIPKAASTLNHVIKFVFPYDLTVGCIYLFKIMVIGALYKEQFIFFLYK